MNYTTKQSFFICVSVICMCCLCICRDSICQNVILPGIYDTEVYSTLLKGRKIGVVANNGSIIEKTNLVDTLLALGVKVTRIFSPEHGYAGKADAGAKVGDQLYGEKKIPIVSLYGKNKKPASEDMKAVDIIVFDLQDVGVRFYTYISTLHYVMEACAEENKFLIVLDRPNPNGFYIDGPILDPEFSSFIGMHSVPVVYGMTIGEYAQMINGEGWLKDKTKCELLVILCENYTHRSYYEIPVPPSPNLKDMKAIYWYPSMAFFEGTVVSEGRGTDSPFLVAGHPDFSGHNFSFKPEPRPGASLNPKFSGIVCYGIDLREYPIENLRHSNQLDLSYLLKFYTDLKLEEKFFIPHFDLLAGTDKLRLMIIEGKSENEIRETWKEDLKEFKKIRAKYLLYPDFE